MRISAFREGGNFPSRNAGVEHAKSYLNLLPDHSPGDRERQTAPVPRQGKFEHLAWELADV